MNTRKSTVTVLAAGQAAGAGAVGEPTPASPR
jgi:hypothetical protein